MLQKSRFSKSLITQYTYDICGGGVPWMTYTLVDVPIRTFHGLRDTVEDSIESLQMAKERLDWYIIL